jgi:hypothetical protein
MRDVLLALGLLLSTATQLRPETVPLGPGEIGILLWLVITLARYAGRPLTLSPATQVILAFGLVLVLSESAGWMMGMTAELFFYVPGILHDIVGYIFLICAATMISIDLADEHHRVRVVRLLTSSGAIALLLQFGDAKGWVNIPGIDPWYFDRLRGWSKDPNQLGFVTAFLVFLGLYLITRSERLLEALVAAFCCIVALVAGVLTKSDTFLVSVAFGAPVFLAMTCRNWLLAPRGSARAAIACIGLLATPLVLLAAVPFTPALTSATEVYSVKLYHQDNQGDARLMLWREALSKGLDSKMIGLGPGPHLVKKSYKQPPPYKFESHNTPLELLTQGGFIASFAFLGLIGWAIFQTCRTGISSLAAMSCGLLVFSMFHFVLRHPIFWFGIVLCLLEADRVLQDNTRNQNQRLTGALQFSSVRGTQ